MEVGRARNSRRLRGRVSDYLAVPGNHAFSFALKFCIVRLIGPLRYVWLDVSGLGFFFSFEPERLTLRKEGSFD